MNRFHPWKKFWALCLTIILLVSSGAFAQDDLDDFGGLDDFGSDSISDAPVADSGLGGDGMMAESTLGGAPAGESSMSETEEIDALVNKFSFQTENPNKDPFKPIVEKKVVLPPVRTVRPVSRSADSKPAPPPVKPIRLFISGIVGAEGNRLAVVKFENNEYTITKDQIVEGKFKVVDILSDRVVVYSNKEQRRHTFKIGGDEK